MKKHQQQHQQQQHVVVLCSSVSSTGRLIWMFLSLALLVFVRMMRASMWSTSSHSQVPTGQQLDYYSTFLSDSTVLPPPTTPTIDIVQLSIRHVEPHSNHNAITAAVCFRTLFGDAIDLAVVIQWAAYNRLLGFDRIFVFYRPEIQQLPFWEELRALPYVTLTEQPLGSPIDNYNQTGTESLCLTDNQFGAKYDWVFFADVDEYLWFDELISVKQFLQRHKHRSYLSFGKQMHSLSNRVMNTNIQNANGNSQQRQSNLANQEYISAKNTSSFAVADYPFYMKHFCLHKSRKNHPICPTWRGRAKVMVRPTVHTKINVHGTFYHNQLDHDDAKNTTDNNNSSPLVDTGGGTRIHFHPDVAHIKEWPEIFDAHTVTRRTPERFVVTSQDEVHIHNIHTGFLPLEGDEGNFLVANGQWQVEYDSDLRHWFDFVIGRPGV